MASFLSSASLLDASTVTVFEQHMSLFRIIFFFIVKKNPHLIENGASPQFFWPNQKFPDLGEKIFVRKFVPYEQKFLGLKNFWIGKTYSRP